MKSALSLILLGCLVSCQTKGADPQDKEDKPATAAAEDFKPETLVGQPLEKAQAACDAVGIRHRVIEIDGESQPVTRDYRPERLNFVVKKGIVTAVSKG